MSNLPSESTSAPPAQPLRTRALTIFLTVTALAMGLGAVISVAPLPPAGLLSGVFGEPEDAPVSFATAPAPRWSAEADAVLPGGSFVRPDPAAMEFLHPGAISVEGLLITAVVDQNRDRFGTLAAYGASDGALRWTTPLGVRPSCSETAVDGLLPCLADDRLHVVRLSDGVIVRSQPVNMGSRPATIDDDLLLLDYAAASRGTPDDPASRWGQYYDVIDDNCFGPNDSQQFGVMGSVAYYGSGNGAIVLDVSDGDAIARNVQDIAEYPGQGLVGRTCDGQPMILDSRGRDHNSTFAPQVGRPADALLDGDDDGPIILGDSAYEFDSGRTVWTVAGASLDTVVGDTVLGHNADGGPTTAYRRSDGSPLWSADLTGRPIATDGKYVLYDSSGLTAVDLATGAIVWSDPGFHRHAFDVVDNGIVASTWTTLRFVSPDIPDAASPAGGADTESGDPIAAYESSDAVLTRCGRTPTMTPVEYRAEQGGLTVRMEVAAACPTGDIVSTDALRVTLVDAGATAASAVFDMSSSPLYLPPSTRGSDTVTVDFTFGPGTFYRMPNALGTTDVAGGTVARPTSGQIVECYDEGTSSGPGSVSATQVATAPSAPVRSDRAALPANVDPEQMALDALRAQARADMPFVVDRLANRWVAQLSSKRPGLRAPDITGPDVTWDYRAILDQHLRLRLQYPEVRLVWSDDWSTFTIRGWWITVAGATFGDADAANRWCDDRNIPTDECFAKIISDTRGPEGTTKYRR